MHIAWKYAKTSVGEMSIRLANYHPNVLSWGIWKVIPQQWICNIWNFTHSCRYKLTVIAKEPNQCHLQHDWIQAHISFKSSGFRFLINGFKEIKRLLLPIWMVLNVFWFFLLFWSNLLNAIEWIHSFQITISIWNRQTAMNIMLFAMIINRIPDIFLTKVSVKLEKNGNFFNTHWRKH